MSRLSITPDKLADVLKNELTVYSEEVEDKLREVTRESMSTLVKKTKATAPLGKRGSFRKNIAGDFRSLKKGNRSIKATWYVKAPDYRLVHLLVHGHATKDGGRTKADPFLENALDEVLPEFERKVEEALKND
jgi:hypothetical protein